MKPTVAASVEEGAWETKPNQCESGRSPNQTIIPRLIRKIQQGEN